MEDKADKARWLMHHITETAGPGILYVSSRKRAQQYSEALLQEGVRVAHIMRAMGGGPSIYSTAIYSW